MILRLGMMFSLLTAIPLMAVEKPRVPEKFDAQQLIANPVRSLPKPKINPHLSEPRILVFSHSMEAQEHVRQGFAWVSASWDFEAYRHFCAAVTADDQCLMAYCGMVLSLTSPQHEFHEQRSLAYNRMLTLAEYKVEDEFYFPENERMYAVAIAELVAGGVGRSARVLRHLAKTYPNDSFAQLLASYLSRGGYSELGRPKVTQKRSVEQVASIVADNPQDALALNFLIMLQAEAPQGGVDFVGNIEPLAKKLVEISQSKVPSWLELHGYIAMRAGLTDAAEKSYRMAYSQFREWKIENKVTAADSDALLRVSLKLAELLYKQGKGDEAQAVLDTVMKIPPMFYRDGSAARVLYEWGLKTFAMKMAVADGDYTLAKEKIPIHLLEQKKPEEPLRDILNTYVLVFDCYAQLEQGQSELAKKNYDALEARLQKLINKQAQYNKHPAFLEYLRSIDGFLLHIKLLKAEMSKAEHGYIYWTELAAETPSVPSRIQPQEFLFPIEYKLGKWYQAKGKHDEAREAYERALVDDPSFLIAKKALDSLGN